MMSKWWENHNNKIELAGWLIDEGCLVTSQDALRFFEKPWKWEPEWEEMRADVGDTAPTEEQLGLDDPEDWAKREPDGVPTIAELYMEERYEEPDEDLRPPDRVLEMEGIDLPSYSELADDIHFWERTP